MAKRRDPSGDVRDLLAATAQREGERVSARQLESWRQAGLVPRPTVQHLGRGRGSSSRYPADAPARVAAAARAVRAHRRLHVAALALFGQGQPLEEHVVRAAYRRHYEHIGRLAAPDPVAPGGGDAGPRDPWDFPSDPAEAAAMAIIGGVRRTRKGRRILRRARQIRDPNTGGPEAPESLLLSTLTTLARGALTGEADPSALQEMLLVTGMSEAMGERLGDLGPLSSPLDADEQAGLFAEVGPEAQRRAVEEASFAELARVRDRARDVLSFARAFTAVVSRTTGLDGAFGFGPIAEWAADADSDLAAAVVFVPILLAALSRDGAGVEDDLALCASYRTTFEALERLLDAIPASYAHLFAEGAAGVEALPDHERERLVAVIGPWLRANPSEEAAIMEPRGDAAGSAVEEAPGEAA